MLVRGAIWQPDPINELPISVESTSIPSEFLGSLPGAPSLAEYRGFDARPTRPRSLVQQSEKELAVLDHRTVAFEKSGSNFTQQILDSWYDGPYRYRLVVELSLYHAPLLRGSNLNFDRSKVRNAWRKITPWCCSEGSITEVWARSSPLRVCGGHISLDPSMNVGPGERGLYILLMWSVGKLDGVDLLHVIEPLKKLLVNKLSVPVNICVSFLFNRLAVPLRLQVQR